MCRVYRIFELLTLKPNYGNEYYRLIIIVELIMYTTC